MTPIQINVSPGARTTLQDAAVVANRLHSAIIAIPDILTTAETVSKMCAMMPTAKLVKATENALLASLTMALILSKVALN